MIGKVRIRTGEKNSLEIDDVDISHSVTGARVSLGVHDIPHVHLDIIGADPDMDFEVAEVLVNERARDVLIQLGWTPPDARIPGETLATANGDR